MAARRAMQRAMRCVSSARCRLRPIRRVLVANRGEIAVRVMRTCQGTRHRDRRRVQRRRSPRAARPDGRRRRRTSARAPAAQSYLVIDKIIDACQQTGADAVHPGYGFLSENEDFADACAAAGITFIGPSAEAMRKMGSKTEARKTVTAAGTPVVPGDNGPSGDGFPTAETALAAAQEDRLPGDASRPPPAAAARACASSRARPSSPAAFDGARREATVRVRRRHRLPREGDQAAAPHRDPGVRRHARQPRPPRRARLLDPAPPPEGDRGGAVAGRHRAELRAKMGAAAVAAGARRRTTSAPARASSCSAPTAASTSSR